MNENYYTHETISNRECEVHTSIIFPCRPLGKRSISRIKNFTNSSGLRYTFFSKLSNYFCWLAMPMLRKIKRTVYHLLSCSKKLTKLEPNRGEN